MSVESVTAVETLLDAQGEVREYQTKPCLEVQAEMQMAVAVGVQAVKRSAKARSARLKEVQARLAAGTYAQDSMAIAQKLLEIE